MSVLNNVCLSKEQRERLNKFKIKFIEVDYNHCIIPVIDLIGMCFIAGFNTNQFISLLSGMYITKNEYLYVAYYLGNREMNSNTNYDNCLIDYINNISKLLLNKC